MMKNKEMIILDEKLSTIFHKKVIPILKNGKFAICKKYKCWIGYIKKNKEK